MMNTPHSNTLDVINRIIEQDKTELEYWKQRNNPKRKIVRNFIQQSEQSLNNIIKLKQILQHTHP